MEHSPDQVDRYEAVRQYSLAQILGVWAAAAVPMAALAWIVAPWLRDQLGGRDPFQGKPGWNCGHWIGHFWAF